MLKNKILSRSSGILTYGITPPKLSLSPDRIGEIAQKQLERVKLLDIDALVVYDIQDESDRTTEERPFPFLPTLDAARYCEQYYAALDLPKIVYRCVAKYSEEELRSWAAGNPGQDRFSVFVGASSGHSTGKLRLPDAYAAVHSIDPQFFLGGVTIPERHTIKSDEHLRVFRKMEDGCVFFISQAVYNVEAAKNFLSDYYFLCRSKGVEMVPILFTLTPCGSLKTMEFMRWLGISVPRWLENELRYSDDILDKSVKLSLEIFQELWQFAMDRQIPIGCNVESVSVRKVEIEASIEMVEKVREIMKKPKE
jgi:hypothetical protein